MVVLMQLVVFERVLGRSGSLQNSSFSRTGSTGRTVRGSRVGAGWPKRQVEKGLCLQDKLWRDGMLGRVILS